MKNLLLVFVCFLFTTNIFAQPKVDTILSDTWKNNSWQPQLKENYSYNSDCQLQFLTYLEQDTVSQSWVNFLKLSITYIDNTHYNQIIEQTWNKDSSKWDNLARISYTYNSAFKITQTLTEIWQNNTWKNGSRTTNTYDVNNYLISTLEEEWGGSAWINANLTNYTNNSIGNVTLELDFNWSFATSAWDTSSRTSYTYNSVNKVLTQLSQAYTTNQWTNSTLDSYTYDANNYLTNHLNQIWVSTGFDTTGNWLNQTQDIYANNSNGSISQVIEQQWNILTSVWENYTRDTYYYTTSCTLPLTLLNLTATKNANNTVALNWQTVNEVNTSHFTIQRSVDATNFTDVGNVNATSNYTINNYSFTDDVSNLKAGAVYYRLQMVDKDGKFTTSKIVSVLLNGTQLQFSIRPNPATNYFVVSPSATLNTSTLITITDLSGKVVMKQNVILNSDQKINISSLQKGVYVVKIIASDGITSTQKLVVQ